jgi:hypothetical protein
MQVEAIYHQGRLEFVHPIKFKHDHLRLVVLVPDDEVESSSASFALSPAMQASAQEMLDKFSAILNAPLLAEDELPTLSSKHIERMEAFELQAQMREEQGRLV